MGEPYGGVLYENKSGKQRSGYIDFQKNKGPLADASSQALGALLRWRRLEQPITARYIQQLKQILSRQTPDHAEPDGEIPRALMYEELSAVLEEEERASAVAAGIERPPLPAAAQDEPGPSGREEQPADVAADAHPLGAPRVVDHAAEARLRALSALMGEIGVPVAPWERERCRRFLSFLHEETENLHRRELHMTPLKYALARCAGPPSSECVDGEEKEEEEESNQCPREQDLPPPPQPGLWLEFGVAGGKSITAIARRVERLATEGDEVRVAGGVVYGFDSFLGLPEEWKPGFSEGHFARPGGEPPCFDGQPEARYIELVSGWFQDTLPAFLAERRGEACSLIHLDCDVYSAASCVLNTLAREGRLVPGTVLVFDELCNYCGCEKHEWRALFELAEETGIRFQWLGIQNKGCMKAALVFCARGPDSVTPGGILQRGTQMNV